MSKQRRNDRKRRKRMLHDQNCRQRKRQSQRVEIDTVVVTQRIKDRFAEEEISVFLKRTLEKYREERKRNPKIGNWLSDYRTLYGGICVLAEGNKFTIMYRDEVPEAVRKTFPSFGQPRFKYSDAEWNNFVQAMWRMTDGERSLMRCGFEREPGAISFEPGGEDCIKVTGSEEDIRHFKEMERNYDQDGRDDDDHSP